MEQKETGFAGAAGEDSSPHVSPAPMTLTHATYQELYKRDLAGATKGRHNFP